MSKGNKKISDSPDIKEVLREKNSEIQKEKYNDYVENMTPKSNRILNCIKAFFVGGSICLLGQCFIEFYKFLGNDSEISGLYSTISLVLLSALLTGLNVYQKIGQFGGAGSLVPITGFANSVASPALEFQAEGDVFGVGCRIFSIAGPVILYGIFSSWIVGVLYYIGKLFGWC